MPEKPVIDYAALGKKIRHKRLKMKLSQDTVSEKVGLSVSFYGHIERGDRIPSIDSLVRISKFLNLNIEYLLFDSTDGGIEAELRTELNNIFRSKSPDQIILLLNILKVLSDGVDKI